LFKPFFSMRYVLLRAHRARQAYMPRQSDHLSFITGDEIAVTWRGSELWEGRVKQKVRDAWGGAAAEEYVCGV
jgi:hypothetical protein